MLHHRKKTNSTYSMSTKIIYLSALAPEPRAPHLGTGQGGGVGWDGALGLKKNKNKIHNFNNQVLVCIKIILSFELFIH